MLRLTIRYANSERTGVAYFAAEHIVAVIPNLLHTGESGIATVAGNFDVTEDPLTIALMWREQTTPIHN